MQTYGLPKFESLLYRTTFVPLIVLWVGFRFPGETKKVFYESQFVHDTIWRGSFYLTGSVQILTAIQITIQIRVQNNLTNFQIICIRRQYLLLSIFDVRQVNSPTARLFGIYLADIKDRMLNARNTISLPCTCRRRVISQYVSKVMYYRTLDCLNLFR